MVALQMAALAQDAAKPALPIHIAVQARTLDGMPITDLTQKDFDIAVHGQQLAITTLTSGAGKKKDVSALPVHVMLMISVYSNYADLSSIATLLKNNLPEDFANAKVALIQRSGRMTDYVGNLTDLIQQLPAASNRRVHFDVALHNLGQFTGRRALVYITEKGVSIPAPFRRQAQQAAALVYQVGGDRWQNYTSNGENYTSGPPPIAGGNVPYGDTHFYAGGYNAVFVRSVRDVVVVRTLRDAFRSVTDDSKGYYDVTLNVPAGTQAIDLKLNLKYDYQLTAQDYAQGEQVPPELHIAKQR